MRRYDKIRGISKKINNILMPDEWFYERNDDKESIRHRSLIDTIRLEINV